VLAVRPGSCGSRGVIRTSLVLESLMIVFRVTGGRLENLTLWWNPRTSQYAERVRLPNGPSRS